MAKYNMSKSEAKRTGQKRRKISSSKSSKNSKKIDYSKRSKGTSKREYQASQLGGVLDKKKNTITVRTKNPTSSSSSGRNFDQTTYNAMRVHDVHMGTNTAAGYKSWAEGKKDISDSYTTDTYKSGSSNRSNASKEYNATNGGGGKTGKTGKTGGIKNYIRNAPSRTGSGGGIGNFIDKGLAEAGGLWDTLRGTGIRNTIGQLGRDIQLGINKAGGVMSAEASGGASGEQPFQETPESAQAEEEAANRRREDQGFVLNADGGVDLSTPVNQTAFENSTYNTSNISADRDDPTPTYDDGGSSSISQPVNLPEIFQTQESPYQLPQPADGGAIQRENATVSRIAGKGNYARGLGYNSEQGLVGGGGLGLGGEDDEMNILQKILASTGMVNSAQASQVPQDNGGFSGQKDYSYNSATIPTNYGYQAENPEGPAPIIQPQEEEPIEYNQTNNQNYEQGGGGNVPQQINAPADRGGLSKREYKAKYGVDYDPTGGLGDFGYAGDDSYEDQGNEIQNQLADMIKGIESQYATAQTKQTGDLERQGRQNLNQLNSQFSFGNSDPNDEQRIQYQQRLQNDQGRNLAELLSSLQASKGQDILSARNQGSTNMQNLMNQQRTARSTAQGNQRDYQTELAKAKSGGSEKNDSLTYQGKNAQGEPVFWNNRTKQTQVGEGLTRESSNPFAGLFNPQQQTQQDNSNQIVFEGKKYNVDSNGNMTPA